MMFVDEFALINPDYGERTTRGRVYFDSVKCPLLCVI